MHYFLRRSIVGVLLLALLIGLMPAALAVQTERIEVFTEDAASGASTITPVQNDNLDFSQQKILGYWINPSNYTISDTNIDRLVSRGVTDLYVLVKGEAGSINTTDLKNVISYADSSVRVHAWLMCARDNSYIKSNPTHAVWHFRFGYKTNAHSTGSSYYVDRNGYVDLRNTSYQAYFNGIVDELEAISGLDGIHLDTIRYGGDYYDYGTNFKNEMGVSKYNAIAKAMCAQYGYTYSTDSDGYYTFKSTTTADGESLTDLVNANGTTAQAYLKYRTETITNFVKSVKDNLDSDMILTAACMPEPAISLYGKSTYGQDFAALAPYVDYVQIMSYFGDYYFLNGDTYDKTWPAELCKTIAKEGCNVVAGIQGYAFVNTDTSGRNGLNPSGYESRTQAEYINDARRLVNGDPTYGGDILGAAVFRTGTSSQVKISYNKSAGTVTFSFVAGATAVKSVRIQLYNGFYVDKSKCTVSGTSYTYNGVTYTAGGTASNGYYPCLTVDTTISAYGTKTLTIPVCTDSGEAVSGSFNNEHFAAYTIYSSTSRSESTYLPVYQASFVDSTHTKCTFTKTTPQPATCLAAGYNLYTCETCGYDYAEYVSRPSHEYAETVIEATCEAQGYTSYCCINGCNDTYTQDYVDALGHNYEVTVIASTCETQGYTAYTCQNGCDSSYQDALTDAFGHSYEVTTSEPSCTQGGGTVSVCTICGYVEKDEISATGHAYDSGIVTKEATCTEDGVKTFTCTACDDSYTETIPSTGHVNTTKTLVAPTCTAEGFVTVTCDACDEVLSSETVAALGHSYEAVITAPTCTLGGYTEYTCSVCEDGYKVDETAAFGHDCIYTDNGEDHTAVCTNCDYEAVEAHDSEGVYCSKCNAFICKHETTKTIVDFEATCTTAGSQHVECDACGEIISESEIAIQAHKLTAVNAKQPTCTESGNRSYCYCETCGSYFTDETCSYEIPESFAFKPATGHSYVYTVNGDVHTVLCSRCGESAEESHVYEEGVCICGAEEHLEPVYAYDENLSFVMSVSVGAEMQVRYTVISAKVKTFESFYLVVTKAVAGGEPVVSTFEMDSMTPVTNPTGGATTAYQAIYAGINAKEMGDVFEAVLYAVAEDGTIYYGAANTTSIKSYLIGKIDAASESDELKTMAVDMLNYGAAAQIRMEYDTEHLVNADLTQEQLAYATKQAPEATDYSSGSSEGYKLFASVSLQSKVMLYLNCGYKTEDPSELKYVIADSVSGEVITGIPVSLTSNNLYQGIYDQVGAKQMRQLITITLYDGQTPVSQSLTWSVESYVASVCAKTSATEAEIAMANAMLIYGDSVAAYLAVSGQ